MSSQSGRGGVGSRKHGKGGKPGHNRDLQQTARDLNRQAEEQAKLRQARKQDMVGSVQEAFGKKAKRRRRPTSD